MIIALRAVEFC